MSNTLLLDQRGKIVQSNVMNRDLLQLVEILMTDRSAIAGEKEVTAVCKHGWVGMSKSDGNQLRRAVTGLLFELAERRLGRGSAWTDNSAGDLQRKLLDSVAELLDHYQFVVRGKRNDVHPIAALKAVKVRFPHAIRRAHAMCIEVKYGRFTEQLLG